MEPIRVFYSWQSDNKDVKKVLNKAVKNAINNLNSEGYNFDLVQDARSDNGSEEIPAGVLEGIDRSDLFIADMTPVVSVPNTNKLQPNANVLFEYGYALRSKGQRFTRLLACLDENQAIEQLPFDINHRKLIKFHLDDTDISTVVKSWILSKREEVITARKPIAQAVISFGDGSNEITLRPLFKRKLYYKKHDEGVNLSNISAVDVIISKIPSYADMLSIPKTTVKVVAASPITKEIHKSLLPVQFKIDNIGNEVIENCNIHIWASDGNVSFKVENIHEKLRIYAINQNNYHISDDKIVRHIDMINPEETFIVANTFIMLPHEAEDVIVNWKYTSMTHSAEGSCVIHSIPEYEDYYIPTKDESKIGKIEIEEIIETE